GMSGSARLHLDGGDIAVTDDSGAVLEGRFRLALTLHKVPLFVDCSVHHQRVQSPIKLWSTDHRRARRVPRGSGRVEWWSFGPTGIQSHIGALVDVGGGGARVYTPPGVVHPPIPGRFPVRISAEGRTIQCMAEVRNRSTSRLGSELGLALYVEEDRP